MGMIMNSMVDERVSSLLKPDGIYRIVEKTMVDRDLKERISAVIALGNSNDPRAVQSLVDCCRDRNPEIRLRAIEGLQSLRSGRSVEVLIERLRDKSELQKTRQHAAVALATIRSYGAIQELKNLVVDTTENGALRSFIGRELDRVQVW
jgi:HEAT repeat protein